MKRMILCCLFLVGCKQEQPPPTLASGPEIIKLQVSAKISTYLLGDSCGDYINVGNAGMYMTFHQQDGGNLMVRSEGLKLAVREAPDLPLLEYRAQNPQEPGQFEYTLVVTHGQYIAAQNCLKELVRVN